jgi:hypothetical protein
MIRFKREIILMLVLVAGTCRAVFGDTVILAPIRDNTLYEDGAGSLSNGAGIYFFAGKTAAPSLRRAVILFDFSSIPSNATITSVSLALYLSKTHGGSATTTLSKASQAWGEGISNAGEPGGAGIQAEANDATWFHTFYNTQFWVNHGGDFSSTTSASTTVGAVNATYTWSGSGMVADVQGWVSNPATNFGWFIRGTETTGKAQRYNSRENISNPPRLTVMYTAPLQTPTPTPNPTATPNPTPKPSPTPTPTATPSPVPTGSPTATPQLISLSGTISYCSNPTPGAVPNVTLNLTGDATTSVMTDSLGNYQFSNVPAGGNYIVTPNKSGLTPGSAGINTVDVVAAQRHFLFIALLPPGCRLTAADVNGDSFVDTIDVIAIQRFFVGFATGTANVGKYQFVPSSRSYSGIVTDQSGEDYDALILGDVASPYVF